MQFSLRALIVFAFLLAILAWQIGRLRNQYFVELSNVTELREAAPNASVEYASIAPDWVQGSRFCPEWFNRVHSVDFVGLLENKLVRTNSVAFGDATFLSVKSNLDEFKSLDNLFLYQTQVTDKTLDQILTLTQVKRLDITGCTSITEAGLQQLIEQRPGLKITEAVSQGGVTTLRTR